MSQTVYSDLTFPEEVSHNNDFDDLLPEGRVHRLMYTDPAIFQEEMHKIFGGRWVYIAHESEIPNPNDYKTGYLGQRPIIITRGEDDSIRVLFNRCTHRGTTVCRENSGSSKTFQCPYHGWTYKNNGELVGVPWKNAYASDFDGGEFNLPQVPYTANYRGFIWGTLNPNMPEIEEYLGPAKQYLDEWIDRFPNGEVNVQNQAHRIKYDGNWKLAYDNGHDGYHPAFSHRSLMGIAERHEDGDQDKDMSYFQNNPDEGPMPVYAFPNGHTFTDQRPNYDKIGSGSYWNQQRPQPGREAYENRIRDREGDKADYYLDVTIGSQMNLNIFPNLLIIGNQIQVLEPITVDQTQLTWYATSVGDLDETNGETQRDVNTLRMRSQEDFPNFGEVDDVTNFESVQRGLSTKEVEWIHIHRGMGNPERYTEYDNGVVEAPVTDEMTIRHFYNEWQKTMEQDMPLEVGREVNSPQS